MARYVIGVSGASGIILAIRLIEALSADGHAIDLVFSRGALFTSIYELGTEYATTSQIIRRFAPEVQDNITLHSIHDLGSAISSGSYPVEAMVIVPCSMTTLAALSIGLGDNALRRAADVCLKEKRPLILVPREAPLSTLHLENMLKLSKLGATIIPPVPSWYIAPQTLQDVENFIVGKILDVLRIRHALYPRWKDVSPSESYQEKINF